MATKLSDEKYVLKYVSDAECVRHERTGKFYIREAEEQHEMSGYFDTPEAAWHDAVDFVNEYIR